MNRTRFFRNAALCATALVALALPAAAQQIGTMATSEPTITGTPPGGGARTLGIGAPVVANERVSSSASGRGQILFQDQTTLALAPNTTIVLDQFVFNPAQGDGQLSVTLTQGALRFIGGTLSRGQEATVTTPSSTIGIRGSSSLILHVDGETVAIFLAGERLCITTNGRRTCTSRQGGILGEDGYRGRADRDFLTFALGLVDGAPGGSGGAGLGSRVGQPNPAERGPVSTSGEETDPEIFDDEFTSDFLLNGVPRGGFFEEGGGEEEGPFDECIPSATAGPGGATAIVCDD